MTKRDWIWAAIRIFGIYLFVDAIIALALAIGSAFVVWQSFNLPAGDTSEMERTIMMMRHTGITQLASSICRMIVCGAAGLYFMSGAGLIFRLVCPPDSEGTNKNEV